LPKSAIHVGMKLGETLAQIAFFVGIARLRDRCNADVFNKQMRSHDDTCLNRKPCRMQKRNRAAIGMA
jgi:hypothetical protein